MENNTETMREEMLNTLRKYAFVVYDLNLYLDTHPYDKKALEMFREFAMKAKQARKEYVESFGPLSADESNNTEMFEWIESPWPWENK